jgi:DNA-binding winged helix-turn-helix (wHTH) protein/tetratricopeptide (TPR) repeat protein
VIWAFGDHELDEELYQLRRRGRPIRIEPRVFDVLLYLLQRGERVVSKRELLDALWPGEAVSESVLPRCIAAARRALRDDPSRQRVIQTVHGRGYRFVAKARERDPAAEQVAARDAGPVAAPESTTGFVGRVPALVRLRGALEEIRAGRGRVALLVGEPGIGKTRTAEELAAEAQREGVRWLAGRCYEGEGAPAFWPWLQVLRALLTPAELDELVPELGSAGARDEPGFDGEQVRFRLFDAIAQLLSKAARNQPLLVTLDDLHWADPDSLRLLDFLATELRSASVLLLASYRDVEVRRDHALRPLLGALARQPHCERIALRGLEREEVAALVDQLAGTAPKPELVDAVATMTEGNPFFVREIVGLLAEEGRLGGDETGALTLALPQGIVDAVGRRLDSLSDDCNALLRAAAVIGRDFDTRLLEQVGGAHGEALLELLGEAEAAQVLTESGEGPGRYAFRHALLRQTLYEELRAPQRVALHRQVGEALVSLLGERPDAPAATIAHHFFEAVASGTAEQAVAWSVRAAERSHALLAYGESARHYERALEALDFADEADATRRCELLIAWGDELRTNGERDAGRARLGEAAELARGLGRSDLLARAAIGYRGFGEMGVPPEPETLTLMREAHAALGDEHPQLRSRLLSRLAGTPPYALSMQTREEVSLEALELARQSDDPTVLTDALGARYWATLGPDRIEERLAVGREGKALAGRLGDRRIALIAWEIDVGAYLMLGDRAGVDNALENYARLADELRQPVFVFLAVMMRASRAMNLGDFEEAETLIRAALERGRGAVPFAELLFAGQLFWLMLQRGELDRAATGLIEVGERAREQFRGFPGFDRMNVIKSSRGHFLDMLFRNLVCYAPLALIGMPRELMLSYAAAVTVFGPVSHANLSLVVPSFLYRLVLTPQVHRIHHARPIELSCSNYANVFPILDVLFGSFAHPDEVPPFDYGVEESTQPDGFIGQTLAPFADWRDARAIRAGGRAGAELATAEAPAWTPGES